MDASHPSTGEMARLVWRLSRAKLTVISAVTHLCAAIICTSPSLTSNSDVPPFSLQRYLSSWLFIIVTQFTTHFFGEVYDKASDELNIHATPLTGGSRVLVQNKLGTRFTLGLAIFTCAISLTIATFIVPSPARQLAYVMLCLALAYTVPPIILNHRALGELDASFITSVLVPHFSAVSQGAVPLFPLVAPSMQLLVIPPTLVKISLFIVLNEADRRPDWATGKVTLPVVLNGRRTAKLHAVLMALAYISAILIILKQTFLVSSPQPEWRHLIALPILSVPAFHAWRLARSLFPTPPYRMDALISPTLFHSTLLVWSILAHSLLVSLPSRGLFEPYIPFILMLGWFTFGNLIFIKVRSRLSSKKDQDASSHSVADSGQDEDVERPITQGENASFDSSRAKKFASPHTTKRSSEGGFNYTHDVVIVGGGIGGLVSAITLHKLGIRPIVLERRREQDFASGADLALWPGAIAILQKLGIPRAFFTSTCYPLHTVLMCNMAFNNDGSPPTAEVLKTIDMKEVTADTPHNFVLVARQRLMGAIKQLLPPDLIVYQASVISVDESEDPPGVSVTYELLDKGVKLTQTVTGRISIGADGARSLAREHVTAACGSPGSGKPEFCNEVTYRGVLDVSNASSDSTSSTIKERLTTMLPDGPDAAVMRINYGGGFRSSFGYMSADGNVAYWWVKKAATERPVYRGKLETCDWPYPLNVLHDLTPDHAFYLHATEEAPPSPRWSSNRVALVGDAAHVMTPNMGQGACLATEDAFILCVLLRRYWGEPDGHIEAFYQYEFVRKTFTESRGQTYGRKFSRLIGVWIREALLKRIPASLFTKILRKNNFPVNSYVEIFDSFKSEGDSFQKSIAGPSGKASID